MQSFELVRVKDRPTAPKVEELFSKAGIDSVVVRGDAGIRLTVEGTTYDIPFGNWVTTNFEKGAGFRLHHYTPTIDEFYALAA